MNYQIKLNQALRYLAHNQAEEAEKILLKLTKAYPDIPIAHGILGILSYQYKKNDQLTQRYLKTAINLDSQDINVYLIAGVVEIKNKNYELAKNYLLKGLSLNKNYRDILYNLGVVNSELENFEESATYFKKCVQINSEDHIAKLNLANTYKKIEFYKEAEEIYKELIIYNQPIIHKNYWSMLFFQRRYRESLSIINDLIKLEDSKENQISLLKNYISLREYIKAKQLINGLKNEDDIEIKYLAGKNEFYNQNFDESLKIQESYLKQVNLENDSIFLDLYITTLTGITDHNYVKNKFDNLIAFNINKPIVRKIRFSYGLWNLSIGNFKLGFNLYQERLDSDENKLMKSKLEGNRQIKNKKIFLMGEQGIGDVIFFVNLLESLINDNSVTILTDKRIIPLIKNKYPAIIAKDNKNTDIQNIARCANDYQIVDFVGNLPQLINFDETRINLINNIKENKKLNAEKLKIRTVGISWNSKHPLIEYDKSLPLEIIQKLIEKNKELSFVNLQYECLDDVEILKQYKNFKAFDDIDKKNDIEKLSDLIDQCDVVLSVSNTTAHISGFKNKRTYVMIPNFTRAIWYWKQSIDNMSIFYPSVKILNFKSNDINDLIENIEAYIN